GPRVSAPEREYCITWTPPPGLSTEFRVKVVFVRFHPFALGLGVSDTVVVGAILSRSAKTARLLPTERPVGLSDETFTMFLTKVAGSCIASVVDPPPSRFKAL